MADREEILVRHLPYEHDMLEYTAGRLQSGLEPGCEKNIVIEAFCLHARNLIEFYTQGPSREKARAVDFIGVKIERGLPNCGNIRNRLNNQISHLTYKRTVDPAEKNWGPFLSEIMNFAREARLEFKTRLQEVKDETSNTQNLPVYVARSASMGEASTTTEVAMMAGILRHPSDS